MELSSSGCGGGRETVTLLSYANNRTGSRTSRYNPKSKCTSSYNTGVVPPVVAKKSDKFFKTFRRRSRSASRSQPERDSSDFRGSECSLNTLGLEHELEGDPEVARLSNALHGRERGGHPEEPKKPDRVTLVGFASHCELDRFGVDDLAFTPSRGSPRLARKRFGRKGGASLDLGGSTSNLVMSDQQSRGNSTTLRTSRDVKMERERQRQEKMNQFRQDTRDLISRMKRENTERPLAFSSPLLSSQDRAAAFSSPLLNQERPLLFSGPSLFEDRLNNALDPPGEHHDRFGQLVQENHERFLQLVREQRAQAFATSSSTSLRGGREGGRMACHNTFARSESQPRVHHIQIQRENLNCEVDDRSGQVLVRKESDSRLEIIVQDKETRTKVGVEADLASVRSEPMIREIVVQVEDNLRSGCDKPVRTVVEEEFSDVGSSCSESDNEGDSTVTDLKTPSTSSTVTLNNISGRVIYENGDESELAITPSDIQEKTDIVISPTTTAVGKEDKDKKLDPLARSGVLPDTNVSSSVQRSLSSSSRLSSSSSGFSSGTSETFNLQQSHHKPQVAAYKKRSVAYYHPTFTNHLGFGRLGTGLRAKTQSSSDVYQFRRDSLQGFGNFPTFTSPFPLLISGNNQATRGGGGASNGSDRKVGFPATKGSITSASASNIMLTNGSKGLQHPVEHSLLVTKSKSSTLESNSSTSSAESNGSHASSSSQGSSGSDGNSTAYRYTAEDVSAMASRYGDSETESEEEEDDDLMDSVSVVAAKNAVSGAPRTKDTDSGRGESPESVSGGRVLIRSKASSKGPRPVSAVPSEYSDISTSSCRSSEGGLEVSGEACPATPTLASKEEDIEDEPEDPEDRASKLEKAHRIATELLTTEEQYVTILHLIDQVFHFRVDQENRSQNLFPPETIPQMFANIKSIYKFHAEFLLPQLRERMDQWHVSEEHQRIGDIFVKFSPFFKMYTEYVKNFDNAISTINSLYQKTSKFATIMDEIHAMPDCRNLSLQHHMLTPIQRIPRYEMLLKGYLLKLPKDSLDREDSEKALHMVSTAAAHANEAMRRIEKFKQLLEVQESLGGTVDLVSPTRELVKEGKMAKISARSGDHQDRYLFLFSDTLLLCSPKLITNRVISGNGSTYKLRARFDVENIIVLEGDNLVTTNTFYIRDHQKSVELYTQTLAEKESWMEAFYQTMNELYQKKSSLRVGGEILRPLDNEIGRTKPYMQKLDGITKCMRCNQPFSMMRKKYHCRACGIVVCAKCCCQKFPLSFEVNKLCRVCRTCYDILLSNQKKQLSDAKQGRLNGSDAPIGMTDIPARPKGLLEVPGNSAGIHSGYLIIKGTDGTTLGPDASAVPNPANWVLQATGKPLVSKRWFVLLRDFVLYSFKNQNDSRALTAMPLPGYTVAFGLDDLKHDSLVPEKERERTIRIQHGSLSSSFGGTVGTGQHALKKAYYLVGSNLEETQRWFDILKLAAKAELPD